MPLSLLAGNIATKQGDLNSAWKRPKTSISHETTYGFDSAKKGFPCNLFQKSQPRFYPSKPTFGARRPSVFMSSCTLPATTCILSLFSTANTIRKAHAAPHIYSVSACHEKWAWTSPKCGACDGPCKSSQKDCSEVAWLSHQKLSALNQIRRYVTKRRACHTKPHDTSFKTSKSDSFCSTCGHRALTANHGESNRGRTHLRP